MINAVNRTKAKKRRRLKGWSSPQITCLTFLLKVAIFPGADTFRKYLDIMAIHIVTTNKLSADKATTKLEGWPEHLIKPDVKPRSDVLLEWVI